MGDYRVLTACPAAQAYVLLGALRSEGINAKLERDGLGAVYGLTFGAFATRVLVTQADFDAATDILRSGS